MGKSPLSQRYLAALGQISVNMGDLESILVIAIARLFKETENEKVGHMTSILAGEDVDKLSEMLLSLFKYKFSKNESYIDLEKIDDRIHHLKKRRNRFLHSHWSFNDDTSSVIRMKFSRNPKTFIDMDLGDLKALQTLANDIQSAQHDILKFVNRVSDNEKAK